MAMAQVVTALTERLKIGWMVASTGDALHEVIHLRS
jgi:hypothetical protein